MRSESAPLIQIRLLTSQRDAPAAAASGHVRGAHSIIFPVIKNGSHVNAVCGLLSCGSRVNQILRQLRVSENHIGPRN